MIQTTTACYGSRGNGMQKVYMKALIPEDTGDGFNIVIIDYMIIDDVEKEIYRKSVYMSYAERDALKSAVVAGYSLTGKTPTAEDAVSQSSNAGSLDLKTLGENRDQISKAIQDIQGGR